MPSPSLQELSCSPLCNVYNKVKAEAVILSDTEPLPFPPLGKPNPLEFPSKVTAITSDNKSML